MTAITPLTSQQIPELQPVLEMAEASMGFVPTSLLTMAHWPELLPVFAALAGTVLNGGEVDRGLKQLIALLSSHASGCRYCQAHTSHAAHRSDVSPEKIGAVFEYESSPLFSVAERAALQVAARAGMVPNAVEEEDMEALREHFSEKQCVEIVAVISLFGFLNRWNDTMATTLEEQPRSFAQKQLSDIGWTPGKHS
jgi:uncharacterized peroxidase-related enzyme